MPPSDEGPSLAKLFERLGEAEATRPALVGELQRRFLDDPTVWADFPDGAVDTLRACLDDPDPSVRCGAVNLLGKVDTDDLEAAGIEGKRTDARVLEAIDDDARYVRQAVVSPENGVLRTAFRSDTYSPKPDAWIAERVLGLLDDPAPVVRVRAAFYVGRHGDALLEAHPDTEAAITRLVGTFDDHLDALARNHHASTPRRAALRALSDLAEHDPAPVADRIDAITGCLGDDHREVRWGAIELLRTLVDAGAVTVEAVLPDVVEALAAGRVPLWDGTRAFLVDIAVSHPEAASLVYEELWGEVRADRVDHSFGGSGTVEALARLVRDADPEADAVVETLVSLVEGTDFDETDPLVVLAPHHPEFVAAQLRAGYRTVAEGERRGRRFDADLAATVAQADDRAVEGVPAVIGSDLSDRELQSAMVELAAVCPGRVAETFPGTLRTLDWEPPIRPDVSSLLEATADRWAGVPENVVAALVATVETERERRAAWRRGAVRALVALYEHGHEAVPDRVDPFVEPYHGGVFDEDAGDPVDPMTTAAAELGGWHPE